MLVGMNVRVCGDQWYVQMSGQSYYHPIRGVFMKVTW